MNDRSLPRWVRGRLTVGRGSISHVSGGLILALAVSLVLRLPFLSMPMISDEGGYAYVAQRWLSGQGRLYHNLWVSRPQGIFLTYGVIFRTLGTSVEALRIGAWLATAATLGFVWLFARSRSDGGEATLAAVLFAVLAGSPAIEGYTANAEVFMALPAAAGAWLLLRTSQRGWGWRPLMAVGACAGVATLLKPSGVVMLPVSLGFLWLVGAGGAREGRRRGAALVAGFLLALAPALLHGWSVGWHAFVYASLTYRLHYQSSASVPLTHHLQAMLALGIRCWALLLLLGCLWWAPAPRRLRLGELRSELGHRLAPAMRTGIVARGAVMPRAFGLARADAGRVLLICWLLGALAGVAMGGDWWPHYLVQVAAPFALWLTPLLRGAVERCRGRWRWALVGLALVALLGPYWVVVLRDPGRMSRTLFNHPGYPMQNEVASYLRRHTPPEAHIYVAFDQAALYYLADRRAAYRYMYDQELRALPGSEAALVKLLDGPNRPVYIIGTRQAAPFPDHGQAFWDAVSEHYRLETTVRGAPVFRALNTPEPLRFRPGVSVE